MIQACIRLISHIIQGKVWIRCIQVFSKLVESVQSTLDCPQVGPNLVTALQVSSHLYKDQENVWFSLVSSNSGLLVNSYSIHAA